MQGRSGLISNNRTDRERPASGKYRIMSLEGRKPYYLATPVHQPYSKSQHNSVAEQWSARRQKHKPQNNYYTAHSIDALEEPSIRSASMMEDSHVEMIPKEVLFLLSDEEHNLQQFKQFATEEKQRLHNDFDDFCREMVHVIDDLRTSLMAQIDLNYRDYVGKYSQLRKEVQQFRQIKRELHSTADASLRSPRNLSTHNNNKLVREIEQQIEAYRGMTVLGKIAQLQKDHYAPIKRLAQELLALGKRGKGMYQRSNLNSKLGQVKRLVSDFTQAMCRTDDYIQSNATVLATTLSEDNIVPITMRPAVAEGASPKHVSASLDVPYQEDITTPIVSEYFLPQPETFGKRHRNHSQAQRLIGPVGDIQISPNSCGLVTDSLERISISPLRTVAVQAQDMLLCCTMLSNRYVCVGSRDGSIYVYTLEGHKVTKLSGHKAGICTLTELKYNNQEYLASGGDLGCGCVFLWQMADWKTKNRWKSHDAAVSCIVSLSDGETFASSSYDKTIKVYSLRTEAVLFNIPNHTNSPVTLLCCNNRGSRLVSASLDNSLNVWRIKRSQLNNRLDLVAHQTCLNIGDIVCQLSSLQTRNDMIALTTNNGRAMLVDIRTAEIRRTIDICNSPIVQLALVESQNRPNHPYLLMCTTSDRNILLAETDTGVISTLDMNNMISMSFGCGVGPKLVFCGSSQRMVMCVLNQSELLKELRICSVELKKFK